MREHWDRDYNRGITRYHETVILHTGTGNPITGNLPAQPRRLISCRIAAEWGQKTSQWGPREDLGDRMPFIIRGRPLRGKSEDPCCILEAWLTEWGWAHAVHPALQKGSWGSSEFRQATSLGLKRLLHLVIITQRAAILNKCVNLA